MLDIAQGLLDIVVYLFNSQLSRMKEEKMNDLSRFYSPIRRMRIGQMKMHQRVVCYGD